MFNSETFRGINPRNLPKNAKPRKFLPLNHFFIFRSLREYSISSHCVQNDVIFSCKVKSLAYNQEKCCLCVCFEKIFVKENNNKKSMDHPAPAKSLANKKITKSLERNIILEVSRINLNFIYS